MALKEQFQSVVVVSSAETKVTIPSGQTQSTALFAGGASFLGFRLPAVWDGGDISFLESDQENGTYNAIVDSIGSLVTCSNVGAGQTFKDASFPAIFYGISYIKLVATSPVAADRVIDVVMAQT